MNRKKLNLILVGLFVVFVVLLAVNTKKYLHDYTVNTNILLAKIVCLIQERYPEVNKKDIIGLLNEKDFKNNLTEYGIDIYEEEISKASERIITNMYVSNFYIIIFALILVIIFINVYVYLNNRNVKKLVYYVEEINKKNYKLDIISNKESDLSILQNEIYKTMVMLRENADNSLKDKKNLKDSLSDISHQLKTPLTSISIMLDNIIDDPNMDDSIRNDFIMDIKREIININFLVYNILKLSLFDTNTVKFRREMVNLEEIINTSIKNVSLLADLKNINITVEGNLDYFIKADSKWEIEAITNIIKNSIEHSNENQDVVIKTRKNDVFTELSINDRGVGISSKDIKNVFKRFYKLNDNDNGFGIGLSLAKEIIEADNGTIKVKSEVGKGTSFIIRYMK